MGPSKSSQIRQFERKKMSKNMLKFDQLVKIGYHMKGETLYHISTI